MAIKQRSYFSRIERQVKFIYYETDCYNYDKDHMIYGYLTVNNRFEKKDLSPQMSVTDIH